MKPRLRSFLLLLSLVGLVMAATSFLPGPSAQAAEGEFFIQVSPSPLVATLKPGNQSTLSLKVRNAGTRTENLTISPRSFTATNDKIVFDDNKTPEIANWLSFSSRNFTVAPGESFEQKIAVNVPKDAGFSYSFALMITRQDAAIGHSGGQELKGQVAVFALMTIDRPGAVRELQLESLKTEAGVYEYLPTSLQIRLKNTGNTIVQPVGNIFIQRGSGDDTPIDTLSVNQAGGYILPGTMRTFAVDWSNGFPTIKSDTRESPAKQHTDWDLSNLSHFRFGHYIAKTVVIYNDGKRDIPLVSEVGFWVVPWKILLGLLIVAVLLLVGVWSLVRQLTRLSKRGKHRVRFKH